MTFYHVLSEINCTPDSEGLTPLHHAARWGHKGAVQLLVDSGADLGKGDTEGLTPLSLARQHGHEDVVTIITEAG